MRRLEIESAAFKIIERMEIILRGLCVGAALDEGKVIQIDLSRVRVYSSIRTEEIKAK